MTTNYKLLIVQIRFVIIPLFIVGFTARTLGADITREYIMYHVENIVVNNFLIDKSIY